MSRHRHIGPIGVRWTSWRGNPARAALQTALLTAVLVAALAGCGSARDTGESPGEFAKAEALYKQHCISCHGDKLEGRVGQNTDLRKVGAKLSREEIVKQIAEGGDLMVPFKNTLSPEEIESLAGWLSAKK